MSPTSELAEFKEVCKPMYYILSILGQDVRKTLGVGMQQLERLKISFKESLYCKVNGKERSVEFKVIYCVITFKVIYVRNNSFDQISMTNIRIYNELKQTGKVEIIKQLIFQIVSIARRCIVYVDAIPR